MFWLSHDRLLKEAGLRVELHETEQIVPVCNIRDLYSGNAVFASPLGRMLTRLRGFVCSAVPPNK
jgi:hypothetical protein